MNPSSTFSLCGIEHSLAHLFVVLQLHEDPPTGMMLSKSRRMLSECVLWSIAEVISKQLAG